jgi:hypothetical protein
MSTADNAPRVYLRPEDDRLLQEAADTGWQVLRLGYEGRDEERAVRRLIYCGSLRCWMVGNREIKGLACAGVREALTKLPSSKSLG